MEIHLESCVDDPRSNEHHFAGRHEYALILLLNEPILLCSLLFGDTENSVIQSENFSSEKQITQHFVRPKCHDLLTLWILLVTSGTPYV